MKIVVAPDSFKGSLSAPEAAEAMAAGVRNVFPDAEIIQIPLADGGEGTVNAVVTATGGQRLTATVSGPLGVPVEARFGTLGSDPGTVVVEMAAAAGLLLLSPEQRNPRLATTYGVGQLLQQAADEGAERIIVGLGGSATNDGGAGAMQALGVRFLGPGGRVFPPGIGGAALAHLERIDVSALRFPKDQVRVIIASDVTNPLVGPEGASAVFGPQKGADAATVAELEGALSRYSMLLRRDLGKDIAAQPGAGAAGGLGGGLMAFLGAEMKSGIDLVLDIAGFRDKAQNADWVLTGEGRIDAQTLRGKTIAGILARCRYLDLPVMAFGGSVDQNAAAFLQQSGLRAAHAISPETMPLEQALREAKALLTKAVTQAMSTLQSPGVLP